MQYAVKLIQDGDAFVATCRDLPTFNSVGESIEDALQESRDAIALALQYYIDESLPIPNASERRRHEHCVTLRPLDVAKAGLYRLMKVASVSRKDLACLSGLDMRQINRLLDLTQSSRIEQLEAALASLGFRIVVSIEAMSA
ncbi:type II toxin-antitoxin system HicB family antitoxin [Dyella sp. 2RAF44]|jgi:antitoxin HicB|uniref:type II toxin-antitoxin system HicB family antitoxin n=1 Tax=Dyella sp. 2RAF44 TaxID=3233000 RepID=UPI003F91C695